MNTPAPPEKKRGGRLAPVAPKSNELPQFYGRLWRSQAQWQREADRLLAEFERTGDMRHFVALSRHVSAMRGLGISRERFGFNLPKRNRHNVERPGPFSRAESHSLWRKKFEGADRANSQSI